VHSSSDVRLKLCSSGVLAAVFELRQEPLCKLYQPRGQQTNLHCPEVPIGLADFWFRLSVLPFQQMHYTRAHSNCNITLIFNRRIAFSSSISASCGVNWISSGRVRVSYDNNGAVDENWYREEIKAILFQVHYFNNASIFC